MFSRWWRESKEGCRKVVEALGVPTWWWAGVLLKTSQSEHVWVHADVLLFPFMKWRTTVVITSLRVITRRKKKRLRKRKKKTSPRRRSLLSTWGFRTSAADDPVHSWHLIKYNWYLFDVNHVTFVKMLVWCHFPAGIQCLGHQLQDGSEGPEKREKGNKEGRKEKNKERTAETAGWENKKEFTFCPVKTGLN